MLYFCCTVVVNIVQTNYCQHVIFHMISVFPCVNSMNPEGIARPRVKNVQCILTPTSQFMIDVHVLPSRLVRGGGGGGVKGFQTLLFGSVVVFVFLLATRLLVREVGHVHVHCRLMPLPRV